MFLEKSDWTRPDYRSRLVAKEYRQPKDDDLFATTPPLETFRTVISSATTGSREKTLMVNDVSRAYMYALRDEDVDVELCDEYWEAGAEQMCGKLSKAMYGTRMVAQMWQRDAGNTLKGAGFTAGRSSPCVFSPSRS